MAVRGSRFGWVWAFGIWTSSFFCLTVGLGRQVERAARAGELVLGRGSGLGLGFFKSELGIPNSDTLICILETPSVLIGAIRNRGVFLSFLCAV